MKRDEELLLSVAPKSYWSEIIRMREIISHHYVDIDAEIVYEICREELGDLRRKIDSIR
ncbi:HepT-like ribonuclease domain-containing protein [Hydrogenimonas sp.]